MAVTRSIGPKVTQPVLYLDAVYGSIAAIITAVSKVDARCRSSPFRPVRLPLRRTSPITTGPGCWSAAGAITKRTSSK